MTRSPFHGVRQIVRFNWPFYVVVVVVNLLVVPFVAFAGLPRIFGALAIAGAAVGDVWLLASLAVSHYVYDRSPIARHTWLDGFSRETVRTAAAFHAGHDETSAAIRARFPDARLDVFDFFDQGKNTEASIRRARALADPEAHAVPVAIDAIPLASAGLDLACVVFAAHEIRRAHDLAKFFGELARVVGVAGRIVVVEHLRDGWNALAYGPGALHFQPRATWARAFASSDLVVTREAKVTPFVTVFELGRRA